MAASLALTTVAQADVTGGVIWVLVFLLTFIGLAKMFSKAGLPAWYAFNPILNVLAILRIAGRPPWWLLLWVLPLVTAVVSVIVSMDVAQRFGRGTGTGLGLAFLPFIFFPILGFGSATFRGVGGEQVPEVFD
ncbi:MAG: DUF5684 domain-containing protein [Planctomycetota bacterium]|jgi:hypothetical protein